MICLAVLCHRWNHWWIQKKSLGAWLHQCCRWFIRVGKAILLAGTALDDAVFGTFLLPAPGKPRSVDLWSAFHTGVPQRNSLSIGHRQKMGILLQVLTGRLSTTSCPMEVTYRLNMAVPPTPRNDPNFSSLGLIQAAVWSYNSSLQTPIPISNLFPHGWFSKRQKVGRWCNLHWTKL